MLRRLVRDEQVSHAVLLEGDAGIGKTALWHTVVAESRAAGRIVLSSRASESEARYSLGALADLLAGVDQAVLAGLPVPQRRALEVVLLLAEDDELDPFEPRATGTAFLSVLRALAARQPVLLAIDDAQWLDDASAEAIGFALRRMLDGERILVLLARRSRTALPAPLRELAGRAERIELGPLSLGAVRRLLDAETDAALSRPAARRIHEASAGNPFFALELGRALAAAGGVLDQAGDLPVPTTLDELLASRLEALPAGAEYALLAVALATNPERQLVVEAASAAGLAAAEDAQLVVREGEHVRLVHPLVGAVVRARAAAADRRALHRALAELVGEREARARHLALAFDPPEDGVAAALAAAAAGAQTRGATAAAAELAVDAWRFTDPCSELRDPRLLIAAENLERIGHDESARALLRRELPNLRDRAARGWARHLLAMVSLGEPEWEPLIEAALADLADDPQRRAVVLAEASHRYATGSVADLPRAHGLARQGHELARASGDTALEYRCAVSHAWPTAMVGLPVERLLADAEVAVELWNDAGRIRALSRLWRGDVTGAQPLLEGLLARAHELEEDWSAFVFALHLFELDCRVGDVDRMARRLAQLEVTAAGLTGGRRAIQRCTALLAATRGDVTRATAAAEAVLADSGVASWHRIEARRAIGLAALGAGDVAGAAGALQQVVDETEAAGVLNPGVFPAAADLVEALLESGRIEEARRALELLETRAREQEHPWGLAAATRARALASLAGGEPAIEAAGDAVMRFAALALPLDEARSRIALGQAERRLGQRRSARTTLEWAAGQLTELGADGFAGRAQAELARVSGRRAREGLTPTEEQVAALAAEGLTNRQIAERLVLAVRTVEAHLTRIYAKLGVRSRTELARRRG